ncbi:hypothetical protein CcaCcLH18_02206 [Colletotrichum camelliae]|nr:hypothetical protein CcaCcLH18_02206 [Colletotrichum camelliae]
MPADYSALPNSTDAAESKENEAEPEPPNAQRASHRRLSFYTQLLLLNILVAALGVLSTAVYVRDQKFSPRPPHPLECSCGSSLAEAKKLDCKYDSLSVSWLPPHCRDDELTAEFERAGPGPNGSWPYYKDNAANVSTNPGEISLLVDLPRDQAYFYTTNGWHVAHCAFYWRKQYRLRDKGFMTERRYDKESHIEHCYDVFKSEDPKQAVKVAAPVWLGGDGSDGHDV